MKNTLFILILSFVSISINAQYGVDNIFRKYKNDKGVVAWQFEGDISSMISRSDEIDIKSSIESVDFVMFSNNQDITEKDKLKLKEKIQKDKYELLVQARDQGQNIKIMGIEDGDVIKKVFAQMKFKEMNAYFFLTGDLFLEDLQKLEYEKLLDGLNID